MRFEPRIEEAIKILRKKTGLPRWQVVLAMEGSKEFKRKIPADVWKEGIKKIEKDHNEPIELTMLKARFGQAGSVVQQVQKVHHRHPSWLEKLGDATVKPFPGLPLAGACLYGIFWLFLKVAGWITDSIMTPFFEGPYDRFIRLTIERFFPQGFMHDMLLGAPGTGYLESLGILTTGVFVPLGIVFPAVLIFYLILTLLEDIGYLPRLAILVDSIFHKIGLHGYSVIPVILSFGCNVPGAMASRILETKRQRFMMLTLLGISIPCTAQTAVILSIIGPFGMGWVILIYAVLFGVFIGIGSLLNQLLPGETPEIAIEIPPYRAPRLSNLAMKAGLRLERFFLEAIPWVFVGIAIVNVLYILRITLAFSEFLGPFLGTWLGLPREAIYPLIIGFLRKDVATGLIAPLLRSGRMDLYQAIISVVILAVYFPCAATFATFLKELGIKDTLKSTLLMIAVALGVGGILHLIFVLIKLI